MSILFTGSAAEPLLDFITSVQDISLQIYAFFCPILSHFSIGHFPTDLRIILSHFVAKEVYAFLLKSLPRVFFSLPGRAMPGVFFPFLV